MKTSIIFIILLFLLIACGANYSQGEHSLNTVNKMPAVTKDSIKTAAETTSNTFNIFDEEVKSIDVDSTASEQQIKANLALKFDPQIYGVDIGSNMVATNKDVKLYGFGKVTIFKVTVADTLPNAILKNRCLVWNQMLNKVALLPLETYELIKTKADTNAYLIGGFFQLKGLSHYVVYNFDGQSVFYDVFNTSNYCQDGMLHVGNSSYNCVSYDPFLFKVSNKDLNNDGYADLCFTGTINVYCKGLEEGFGREDRKPLEKIPANVTFYTYPITNEWKWIMKDSSFCQQLQKLSKFLP